MKSYPSKAVTKTALVAGMVDHELKGRLTTDEDRGISPYGFSGDAIECSVFTINCLLGTDYAYDDREAVSEVVGIPECLVSLQKQVFEGLPANVRANWPACFYMYLPPGVDVSPAIPRIEARILRDVALQSITEDFQQVRGAVETVNWAIESGNKTLITTAVALASHTADHVYAGAPATEADYAAAISAARAASCAGGVHLSRLADYAAHAYASVYPVFSEEKKAEAYNLIAKIVCEEFLVLGGSCRN